MQFPKKKYNFKDKKYLKRLHKQNRSQPQGARNQARDNTNKKIKTCLYNAGLYYE